MTTRSPALLLALAVLCAGMTAAGDTMPPRENLNVLERGTVWNASTVVSARVA